jgi:hypothetical protein
MPNGYTGGFAISKSELQRLLEGLESNREVGQRFYPERLAITVQQLDEMAERQHSDTFSVEEQYHSFYTIFISHALEDCVAIPESSPIREGLAKYSQDGRPRWPS